MAANPSSTFDIGPLSWVKAEIEHSLNEARLHLDKLATDPGDAKAAKYASAGIDDYWVLDLSEMRLVVHRNPVGERYESIVAYFADEPVAPLAAEGAFVCLRDLVSTD